MSSCSSPSSSSSCCCGITRASPPPARLTRLACGFICGGALGNAADRLQHGLVIDFIHYQIPGLISNVSNLADHAIVLGALLLLLESWLPARRKHKPLPADKGS